MPRYQPALRGECDEFPADSGITLGDEGIFADEVVIPRHDPSETGFERGG